MFALRILHIPPLIPFLKKDLLIYFRERACMYVSGGGTEGENLQAESPLSSEPDMGLDLTTQVTMT